MSNPTADRAATVTALKALRSICKPSPLRGEAVTRLAVDRDDVEAPHRPTERLVDELLYFGEDNPKLVLFGSVGSGKSTELARLDRSLGAKYLVVGLDPVTSAYHRHGLDAMSTEGLVLLSGLAIARAADAVWKLPLTAELRRLEAAAQALVPSGSPVATLDLGRLMKGLFLFGTTLVDPTGATGVVVDLLSKTSDAISTKIDLGEVLGPARLPSHARELVDAVNAIIAAVLAEAGRPPLLLIDETDKITDPKASFRLLTEYGALASLACPAVVAGPNSLQGDRAHQLAEHGFSTGNQLYHIRVWQTDDPRKPDPEGLAKMAEIIDRRVVAACADAGLADLAPRLVSAEARRQLAQMSGGVIRDLLGLVAEAARAAVLDRTGPVQITAEHAQEAIEVRRREREVFQTSDHIDVLREVERRRALTGGDIGLGLLARNHILMYSNDHPWYYPHALLLNLIAHSTEP